MITTCKDTPKHFTWNNSLIHNPSFQEYQTPKKGPNTNGPNAGAWSLKARWNRASDAFPITAPLWSVPHYAGVSWVRLTYHLSLSSRWGSWVRLTEAVICAGAHWLVKERKFEPRSDNSLAHGSSVCPSASSHTLACRERSSCPQHSCLSPKIHSTQEGQKTSSQREHAQTSQRTRAACTVCSTSVSQALLCEAQVLGVGRGWGVEVAVRIEPGGAHSDCEVPA